MIIQLYVTAHDKPYIAGSGDGIVTVAGKPAARRVYLLDAITLTHLRSTVSLQNGHYMFSGLEANRQYLIMCRDLPPDGVNQRYETFVWDYVIPATDLTVTQQQELWQQMQGA